MIKKRFNKYHFNIQILKPLEKIIKLNKMIECKNKEIKGWMK